MRPVECDGFFILSRNGTLRFYKEVLRAKGLSYVKNCSNDVNHSFSNNQIGAIDI